MSSFPHLPVTDFPGCTQNFEKLLPLLNASEESATRGRSGGEAVGAWTALTLGPKVEAGAASQTIRVRTEQRASSARLRGTPLVKAGETLTAGETLATLPEAFRPPGRCIVAMTTSASTATFMTIATTGVLTLQNNLTAGQFVFFDGVTWNLT